MKTKEENIIDELNKRIDEAIVFIENFSLKKNDKEYMTSKEWRKKLIKILKGE